MPALSVAERFVLPPQAEPLQAGAQLPRAHGYAWRTPSPSACLVLLHGLQSHAQWFAEAGPMLRGRGLSVYALDRRGSGSSPGLRGDIADFRDWFAEAGELVSLARNEYPGRPVHLAGHCFGANIALGYALSDPGTIASVMALAAGLYVLPDYSPAEKLMIAISGLLRPRTRFRVPQRDDLFTSDTEVLAWIEADRLGAKTVTARCLLQTRRMLAYLRGNLQRLSVPLLVLEAARDRLSDNKRNRAALEHALGERCTVQTFDGEHLLLAEPCRDDVLDAIAAWVAPRPEAGS